LFSSRPHRLIDLFAQSALTALPSSFCRFLTSIDEAFSRLQVDCESQMVFWVKWGEKVFSVVGALACLRGTLYRAGRIFTKISGLT
jgi:hypothetical protein